MLLEEPAKRQKDLQKLRCQFKNKSSEETKSRLNISIKNSYKQHDTYLFQTEGMALIGTPCKSSTIIVGGSFTFKEPMKFWKRKIIRVGNTLSEVYQVFKDMLKNFDREDLDKLWSLVKERFNSPGLIDDKEKELWIELKRLFEPDDL
ncbi:hypothetical protein Tco_0294561 [Tanacetum coccineum]